MKPQAFTWPKVLNWAELSRSRTFLMISLHFFGVSSALPARNSAQVAVTWPRKIPGLRIRIRIGSKFNRVSGSGSRRAKMTHKSKKNFMLWSVRCSLLRAESFFCNLDVIYLFNCNFFINFGSLNPWIRNGSGSRLVFSLKCWIRIRMKWMRIRNHRKYQSNMYTVHAVMEVLRGRFPILRELSAGFTKRWLLPSWWTWV